MFHSMASFAQNWADAALSVSQPLWDLPQIAACSNEGRDGGCKRKLAVGPRSWAALGMRVPHRR